jgi:hypothetical protein
MRRRLVLFALAASVSTCGAQPAEELQNWFNDPFFQISASIPDCPIPAGPFVNESDRRVQAHRRLEKGTTCWLAHECERHRHIRAYDKRIGLDHKRLTYLHNGRRERLTDTAGEVIERVYR